MKDLRALIRDVPGFPKEGIIFKDIMPLVADPVGLDESCQRIADYFRDKKPDLVVGPEARGFIVATGVALKLGVGLVTVRKKGKLPADTIEATYELEYGTDTVAMHSDAVKPGQRVLVVDDLLATGGTVAACCELAEELGGEVVGCGFIIELTFLSGREKLANYGLLSLVKYSSG